MEGDGQKDSDGKAPDMKQKREGKRKKAEQRRHAASDDEASASEDESEGIQEEGSDEMRGGDRKGGRENRRDQDDTEEDELETEEKDSDEDSGGTEYEKEETVGDHEGEGSADERPKAPAEGEARRIQEEREEKKVYACRLLFSTGLLNAARKRLELIQESRRFAWRMPLASPVHGLEGHMPSLENMKRRTRLIGYTQLFWDLRDRPLPPAPVPERQDFTVPRDLVTKLSNTIKLSDMLIRQDREVASAFDAFLETIGRHPSEGDASKGTRELAKGNTLAMPLKKDRPFPAYLFRATPSDLEKLRSESTIPVELIGDLMKDWTLENIFSQLKRLVARERKRFDATQGMKRRIREEWAETQHPQPTNEDAFLLALFLL